MRQTSLLFLTLLLSIFLSTAYAKERPLINVSAEGVIQTRADMAQIHIDIQALEPAADDARSKTDQQVSKLLEILKGFKIKEGSLDTSQTTIYPEYDYNVNPRQLLAYRANRAVSFALLELTQLEQLIKAVSELDHTSLSQTQFTVQDKKSWEDAALRQALQLAKAKAQLIAEEMGVSLKGIYRVNHQVNQASPPVFARAMEMSMDKGAASTYEQKDLEVHALVEVAFNFK